MKEYALGEIARLINGKLLGDAETRVNGVAALSTAEKDDIASIYHLAHRNQLQSTRAGVILMTSSFANLSSTNNIVCADPLAAMMQCIDLFAPENEAVNKISTNAVIDECATIGNNVSIGHHTTIHAQAVIGDYCQIGDNVVIEAGVKLGKQVKVAANSIIYKNCEIEDGVDIDYGCVIGARPFNYYKTKGSWRTGPALGKVKIGKLASIGANTVIDRGSLADTIIEAGVIIDNLVQIGHDVIIGAATSIAGCVAVGAYTAIGRHCSIGGGSCVASLLTIADDVVITGMSAVSKSLKKQGIYSSGTTVSPHKTWRRNAGRFHRLDNYIERLKRLEKQVL